MDLEVWACPVCGSTLEETVNGLRCSDEDRVFRTAGGLPVLLRPEEEPLLQDAESHASAWKRDRYAPPRDRVADLPYVAGATWAQKARSLEALVRLLGPASGRRIVDVGAGTGWLSRRLSERGFRCYAVDLSSDTEVGLGAADTPKGEQVFDRAIGALERWPLRDDCVDVAICNASLHYIADVGPVIAEAARVLRRDGVFFTMNDPVHVDSESAVRASHDFRDRLIREGGQGRLVDRHRHFVASTLEADLRRRFSQVTLYDPDYGFRFQFVRRVKSFVLGMELASFPIYIASKG